jgi:hypothetical protein
MVMFLVSSSELAKLTISTVECSVPLLVCEPDEVSSDESTQFLTPPESPVGGFASTPFAPVSSAFILFPEHAGWAGCYSEPYSD